MSWKRILQTARRLGSPVIVVDEAGKEPLVILSLDAYEKMTTTGKEPGRPKARVADDDELAAERMASIFESAMEDLGQENLPELSKKNALRGLEGEIPETDGSAGLEAEIPLEDKYYFEPLDDGPKK